MNKKERPDATSGPSQSRKADDSTLHANDATSLVTAAQIREWGPLSVQTRNAIAALHDATGEPIGAHARYVLRCLLDRTKENTWGDCYPGKGELCNMSGLSKATVKRALAELERADILRVQHRPNGARHLSNVYGFNLEAFAAAANRKGVTHAQRSAHGVSENAPGFTENPPGFTRTLPPGFTENPPGFTQTPKRTPNEHFNNDPSQPAPQRAPRADEGTIENLPSPDTASAASAVGVDPALSESTPRVTLANAPTSLPSIRFTLADAKSRAPERKCSNCSNTWKSWNADEPLCPQKCRPLQRIEREKRAIVARHQ